MISIDPEDEREEQRRWDMEYSMKKALRDIFQKCDNCRSVIRREGMEGWKCPKCGRKI